VRIARITIGVIEEGEARAYEVEPHSDGLTVVPVGALGAEAIASAVRHALSQPEPRGAAEIPFVRVALVASELTIEVADDAGQSMRMMTAGRPEALPQVIEAGAGDDDEMEALLLRISDAAGMEQAHFALALGMGAAPASAEASEEELGYVEAQRRASRLAAAVREIDDKMTASVVPDWLWVATGFGGLGVLLTAIVFLYPETRVVLIPSLIALSLAGFAMYGWRSWKELRVRGRLQLERSELRELREAAREAAKKQRAVLVEQGRDPDAVLVRLSGMVVPSNVPAVLARDYASLGELEGLDRSAIVFVPGSFEHARVAALTRKVT
jgi:hypothetical protein